MQNTADAVIWQVCKNATVGCHLPATEDLFHASHQDMSRGKERGKRLESPLKSWSWIGTHVEKGEAARLEVEGRPVDDVEDDEDDGEGDEHGHVHLASLVLLHRRRDLPERVDLHLK